MKANHLLIAGTSMVAFGAGYVVCYVSKSASRDDALTRSQRLVSGNEFSKPQTNGDEQESRLATPEFKRGRIFSLNVGQLEAVLNMGMTDSAALFPEMGLSPTQIDQLLSNYSTRQLHDYIHPMEIAHASVHEDHEGDYIEIEPFPAERSKWISSIENQVREIVDNENTPIISRALIARSGLLEHGLFRRQIRFSRDTTGRLQIRESTYDLDGTLTREDYGVAFPEDVNRWENLLPIPEE